MKTRMLSTLLALCMVLALLPGTAWAANVAFGPCGDNVTWALDSAGTLTITGSGKMKEESYWANYPWCTRRGDIKSIVIGGTVSNIPKSAFSKSENLTSVTIPASMQSIGYEAFYKCDKLKSIYFSGTETQWNKISIETSNYKFMFPVGGRIYYSGSPNTATVASGNCGDKVTWALSSAGKLTIAGSGKMREESYWANYPWCTRRGDIKSIVISGTVSNIPKSAFSKSENLTSVTIPASMQSIGYEAFYKCNKLKTIHYSGTEAQWSGIGIETSNYKFMFPVGGRIYYSCSPNTSTIASGSCGDTATWALSSTGTLTITGSGKMREESYWANYPWCTRREEIKSIVINGTISNIPKSAFSNSANLTSVTVPASVKTIGYEAFYKCGNIKDIYYAGSQAQWAQITIDNSNNKFLFAPQCVMHPNSVPDPIQYTITFNANGGTTPVRSIKLITGEMYGAKAILPVATRSGYTFGGWFTEKTGGVQIRDTDTFMETSDQILYAHWIKNTPTPGKTYTITLDANGGKVSPSSIKVESGKTYFDDLPTPTRSGYKFAGWYTSRTGNVKITSSTKATSNRTIYAHWTSSTGSKTHMVTFDANGGTVHQDRKIVSNGVRYRDLPTPTKNGSHFQSWYTQKTGGTRVTEKTRVNLTADQTLYARWQTSVSIRDTDNDSYEVTIPANYELALYTSNRTASISRVKTTSTYLTIDCTQKAELSNGTERYYGRVDGRNYWFTYSCEMDVD